MSVRVQLGDGVADLRFEGGGEARDALHAVWRQVHKAEVVDLVARVADGRVFEREVPERWIVDTRVPEQPERFRAWSPDAPEQVHYGARADLVAAAQALSHALLAPYDERDDVPGWIADLRQAQVALLSQR